MSFDIDQFHTLQEQRLHDYMEPLLTRGIPLSSADIAVLFSRLSGYDEYHLVYALNLLSLNDAACLPPVISRYLADSRPSVLCAAANVISGFESDQLTERLRFDIEELAATDCHPLVT